MSDPIVFGPLPPEELALGRATSGKTSAEQVAAGHRFPSGKTSAVSAVMVDAVTRLDADPGPFPPATGWRAAPDCARCGDTGRATTRLIPEREITPELLRDLLVVMDSGATPAAGLAAALERVLTPCVTDAYCTCKRGRKASELWWADKHGTFHPDAPEPSEPDDL